MHTMMRLYLLLVNFSAGFTLLLAVGTSNGSCETASEPGDGRYVNQCIENVQFSRRRVPFHFINTTVTNVMFDSCSFANVDTRVVRFFDTTLTKVTFRNILFTSESANKQIHFTRVVFDNVHFNHVEFYKSLSLVKFDSCEFRNVYFRDVVIDSEMHFEYGTMQNIVFHTPLFFRNHTSPGLISFKSVRIQSGSFVRAKANRPIRFDAVNITDLHFDQSEFREFHCNHPDRRIKSSFETAMIHRTNFNGSFNCANTIWNSLELRQVNFQLTNFSNSYLSYPKWRQVRVDDCHTLDLSNSKLEKGSLVKVNATCLFDLSGSVVDGSVFRGISANPLRHNGTLFVKIPEIDKQCCNDLCSDRQCRCEYPRAMGGSCNTSPTPSISPPQISNRSVSHSAAACFPANTLLNLADGSVMRMSNVRVGARVQVDVDAFSEIFFFGHRDLNARERFIRISHTGPNSPLTISPRHYLYLNGRLATADLVQIGDSLENMKGMPLNVTNVGIVDDVGLFAPASLHGDIVVGGVRTSSYTSVIHPKISHILLAPFRMFYRFRTWYQVGEFTFMHFTNFDPLARLVRLPLGPGSIWNNLL